jgi:hypothetical protein
MKLHICRSLTSITGASAQAPEALALLHGEAAVGVVPPSSMPSDCSEVLERLLAAAQLARAGWCRR